LHLDRLPLWSALLELLTFIDPTVPGKAALDASPGEIANRLQRLLYAYLVTHAQPLHQQRRLAAMLQWLQTATPQRVPLQAINDANVLSYWRQPPEDAQDITRLRTVIDAFLSLREALGAVQRASAAGQSVPFEELGEGLVVGEAAEAWLDPEDLDLCALSNYPRFLTTRAAETLQLLAKHPEAIHRLPLSLARHAVWGELQARWIEAGKRRRLIDPREESRSYSQWIEALSECRDELQQIQSATLGVLLQQGEVTAVLAVLAESQPELAAWLRQRAAVPDRLDSAWLASWRLRHAPLNAALQRVERALKTTTRSGFKGAHDFADSAIYLNALQAIAALISRVGRLQAQRADWSADFTTDRSIVRQRLLALHAGDTDSHDPHV